MWRRDVDLLAYHDLDGRSGFKLALQEAGGRFFLYVAGFWHSGWSILEVTDLEHPKLLRWLDGPPNTMTIEVQVADGTMITALEHPPPGLTIGDAAAAPQDGVLIWTCAIPTGLPPTQGWRAGTVSGSGTAAASTPSTPTCRCCRSSTGRSRRHQRRPLRLEAGKGGEQRRRRQSSDQRSLLKVTVLIASSRPAKRRSRAPPGSQPGSQRRQPIHDLQETRGRTLPHRITRHLPQGAGLHTPRLPPNLRHQGNTTPFLARESARNRDRSSRRLAGLRSARQS